MSIFYFYFLASLVSASVFHRRSASPTVTIPLATVVGSTSNNVDTFLGIPYAQPPVGNLRLRKSLAANQTLGLFKATATPKSCPQFGLDTSTPFESLFGLLYNLPLFQAVSNSGEDCLTINVQRPSNTAVTAKLPVMVWIYGGAYNSGSTQGQDGADLVRSSVSQSQPMIFVQFNYRLNGFGFLPGKEMLAEGNTNLGLQDQRLALQWVADNVAAFGGDPTKVTIFGESAGSTSVFNQLIAYGGDNTYNGKSLFRGAIMDSGSMTPIQTTNSTKPQSIFNQVVKYAGCSSSADPVNCLRGLSYTSFLNAVTSVPGTYGQADESYRPRVDFDTIPYSSEVAIQNGKYAKVPFIVGDQEDEGTLQALFLFNITTPADLVDLLQNNFYTLADKSVVQQVVGTYSTNPADGSPFRTGTNNQLYTQYKLNAAVVGDLNIRLLRRAFLSLVGSAVPTWSYVSSYGYGTPFLGTYHSTDLAYVFGTSTGFARTAVQSYYISFVNDLNPNTGKNATLATWDNWTTGKQILNISSTTTALLDDDFRNSSYATYSTNLASFRI